MRRPYQFLLTLAALCTLAQAEDSDPLASYHAESSVSGTIRAWGNNEMAALVTAWEKGFQRFHPSIQFEDRLMGPASAMAGIYTGVADLSFMGHELLKEESMAFEWVFRYQALGIEVATASLDVHPNNATLVVFVHKDNPISKLTWRNWTRSMEANTSGVRGTSEPGATSA